MRPTPTSRRIADTTTPRPSRTSSSSPCIRTCWRRNAWSSSRRRSASRTASTRSAGVSPSRGSQANLKEEQIIVEEKKANTDALIVSIGQEKAIVDEAVEAASGDEAECAQIAEEVSAFQAECEKDLAAAEPIIQAAEAALNSLDKKALGELKSLASPPAGVDDVASACMVLCSPGGRSRRISPGTRARNSWARLISSSTISSTSTRITRRSTAWNAWARFPAQGDVQPRDHRVQVERRRRFVLVGD